MVARSGGRLYFRERFGLSLAGSRPAPVWFHAASVGEIRLAMPLINSAIHYGVLVTCNTPDAYRLAVQRWGDSVTIHYCPLDYVWSVRQLLRHYQPAVVFIIETELWPELYFQCAQHSIPIHIINGRISNRTYQSNFLLRVFYRRALQTVTKVWARNSEDRQRFLDMGCPPDKATAVGSIKMTRQTKRAIPEHPLLGKEFSLAVSTHASEELIVARAWRAAADNHLLVIIPRHAQRGASIARLLKKNGLRVARRTEHTMLPSDTDILIADTVGEVDDFCAHAKLIFIGGSMVKHGGHNVIEAAARGKATIVGPYTDNFMDEVEYLSSRGALEIAKNEQELASKWAEISGGNSARHRLEAATIAAFRDLPDRVEEYIELVAAAIDRHHATTHLSPSPFRPQSGSAS